MIHTIHIKPGATGEERWATAKAVPESKAKWALIAPPLWMAWHRLTFELTIYVSLGVVVLLLLFTSYALAAIALAGFPSLYVYLEGNQLRRHALDRHGYQMVDLVDAPDEEMALAKYFDMQETVDAMVPETSTTRVDRKRPASTVRDDDLSFGMFGGTGI